MCCFKAVRRRVGSKLRLHAAIICLFAIYVLPSNVVSESLCNFVNSIGDQYIDVANVTEDWPINSTLMHVDVRGNDSEISLSSESYNTGIMLDRINRNLIVTRRLEVLSDEPLNVDVISITITCTPVIIRAPPLSPVTIIVYISVFDTNDHWPTFLPTSNYRFNVSEASSIGTQVGAVSVQDLDPSDINYLSYSIDSTSSPYASSFAVNAGVITLRTQLNYELTTFINFTLRVQDNSNGHLVLGQPQPVHTSTATVFINVISAYDSNPAFTATTYVVTVDGSLPQGSVVNATPTIGAYVSNSSAASSRRLIYSIVIDGANDDAHYFTINNLTGQLSTTSTFTYNTPNVLSFQIKVSLEGLSRRYSTSLVRVEIVGQRAPPVAFEQSNYNVTVPADLPVGSFLTALSVQNRCLYWSSAAKKSSVVFSIANSTPSVFNINAETGVIYTVAPLNYKFGSSYVVNVQATDGYTSALTGTAYIPATDGILSHLTLNTTSVYVSVQSPVSKTLQFTNKLYQFNASSRANGTVIGSVQAISPNVNSTVTYSINSDIVNSYPSDLFAISSRGQLTTGDFVSSSFSVIALVIAATDNAVPSTQDVAVAVINFPPLAVSPSTSTILPVTSVLMSTSPTPVTSSSEQQQSNSYLIALIVIGVVGGFLLLIIIAMLVFVCRKTQKTCEKVESSRSDVSNQGFRATDDFISGSYPQMLNISQLGCGGETSTDVLKIPSTPGNQRYSNIMIHDVAGSRSPISSVTSSKDGELAASYDGSSGKPGKLAISSGNQFYSGNISKSPGLASKRQSPIEDPVSAVGMDPGTISSTETLVGPLPYANSAVNVRSTTSSAPSVGPDRKLESAAGATRVSYNQQQLHPQHAPPMSFTSSNQSSLYMSSPEGSMLSIATQAKSDDGNGITVYY